MKITILADLAPPHFGGGENYVKNISHHLVEQGHEVHWITSRIPHTQREELLDGIAIHRIPILFKNSFLFPGRQTFAFTSVLQKLSFIKDTDIIQANTFVAGYSGWRVARKYNKPSLLFCHELFGDMWRSIGRNPLERNVYPRVERSIARAPYDWFACPSEYSKSTLVKAGAPPEKITVIPHGVDHTLYNTLVDGSELRRRFGIEGRKVFGYMGRLRVKSTAQSKNLPILLEAAAVVSKTVKGSCLVMAGSGYEELLPYVKRLGLEDKVVFTGPLLSGDGPKFLRMCDAVVCPSVSDGFCFLLAEASACGVPVVATRAGAHPDRVVDGSTGRLVETNPRGIAQAVIELLTDQAEAHRMGERGVEYARRYDWRASARSHIQLYETVVSGHRRDLPVFVN